MPLQWHTPLLPPLQPFTVLLTEVVPAAALMARATGRTPSSVWVPRIVAAILSMPLEAAAADYVKALATGAIRWDGAAAAAAVQARV